MTTEYRVLKSEDLEQSAYVDAVAFYGTPSPERIEMYQRFFLPEWSVGAFVDGRLVADVRAMPMARRMNGGSTPLAAVGPVAALASHRRQGHVRRLLTMSLELMRERGQPLSGLYTPHDALYRRYGWERAEERKRYSFAAKDVTLRFKGRRGHLEEVTPEGWERFDAIHRRWSGPRNGPITRIGVWWQHAILQDYGMEAKPRPRSALIWVSPDGRDEGYVVYQNQGMAQTGPWQPQAIWCRDFVALSGDAYLALWEHLLTHDIAQSISVFMPVEDTFVDLVEDPRKVNPEFWEGPMIRIVDLERAIGTRRYAGDRPASFTMRVVDPIAPWNDGTWAVEAANGRMNAEKTDSEADVELMANTLAPINTGYRTPEALALSGWMQVNRPEALEAMGSAFAVAYPPFCPDWY